MHMNNLQQNHSSSISGRSHIHNIHHHVNCEFFTTVSTLFTKTSFKPSLVSPNTTYKYLFHFHITTSFSPPQWNNITNMIYTLTVKHIRAAAEMLRHHRFILFSRQPTHDTCICATPTKSLANLVTTIVTSACAVASNPFGIMILSCFF